jgi:malate dehydrogenase
MQNLFIGVPVTMGAKGIEQIIEIKLNEEEKKALRFSAEAVRKLVEDMKRLSK